LLAKKRHRIPAHQKVSEGRPNIKDFIKNNQVQLIITRRPRRARRPMKDKFVRMAVLNRIPIVTTLTGGPRAAKAIKALKEGDWV